MGKKVDIGLDIGIASVGWAIATADDKHEIIKHGARLFDTVDDKKDSSLKNEQRRLKRHLRRQYARIKTRKRDLVKLMVTSGLVGFSNPDFKNRDALLAEFRKAYVQNNDLVAKLVKKYGSMYVYEIRAKGAKQELSKEELIVALYWYASHRGHSYTSVDDQDGGSKEKKGSLDYASLYSTKYSGKHPAEAQLDFFKHYFANQTEGTSLPPFLKGAFNRGIDRNAYEKELEEILKANAHILPSSSFASDFLALFARQRDFSEGPGDEKSPTPYGRYFSKDERGNIVKRPEPLANLWDEKIGHCALYPEEFRAPRSSMAAELFNLLNAVNNTRVLNIPKSPFYEKTRRDIINVALEKKSATKAILKLMAKALDLSDDSEQIILPTGSQKSKNGDAKEPALPSLDSFHEICKALPSLKKDALQRLFDGRGYAPDNVFDAITNVLYEDRTEEGRSLKLASILLKHNVKFTKEELHALSKVKFGVKTHGFSLKALGQFIGEMLDTGANGEQIRLKIMESNRDVNRADSIALYGDTYLKSDWVRDAIGIPTVRRSVIQSTVVLNALFTYCRANDLQIDDIVIEMAREKNNKEEREKYEAINANREDTRKRVAERLVGVDYPSNTLVNKVWLLEQQKCCDAYTGEMIQGASGASGVKLEMLLRGFEIDHIIPRTQSFDNSRSNSALTSKDNNARKGNRTPYQFLGAQRHAELAPKWATWYRDSQYPFKDKHKLERFLSTVDYSNVDNQEGFINRNLVDTQYATKEVLLALRSFFANRGAKTKVKTINGRMTSYLRGRMHVRWIDKETGELKSDPERSLRRPKDVPPETMDLKKDRTWHGHHAEDAYIAILLNAQYVKGKQVEKYFLPDIQRTANFNVGSRRPVSKQEDSLNEIADIGRGQLNLHMDQMCFSRMILRPQNTQLFDETLYGGFLVSHDSVRQLSKIYLLASGTGVAKVRKYFDDSMQPEELSDELVIYKSNRSLYDALKRVFARYDKKGKENPFADYVADKDEAMSKSGYPHVVVSYLRNGKTVTTSVKSLLVRGPVKKQGAVVKAPNNANSFYSGANWIELRVYKKNNGDFFVVPVNAVNYYFVQTNKFSDHFDCIPKNSLIYLLQNNGIDKNAQPAYHLKKGQVFSLEEDLDTYFLSKNQLVYLVGFESSMSKLEVKPLHRLNFKGGQIYRSLKTFTPVQMDALGLSTIIKRW